MPKLLASGHTSVQRFTKVHHKHHLKTSLYEKSCHPESKHIRYGLLTTTSP